MPAASNPTSDRGPVSAIWRLAEGAYIRQLRHENGLTQEELAARVGLNNKQIVCAIEGGKQHVPPERVLAFAPALNVSTRTFCARVLRYSNPWCWGGIYGIDHVLAAELRMAADRVNRSRTRSGDR